MALRYDQGSGRLELVLGGQQLKTILIALQDVLQCLQTSPVISDVLLNPDKFVKQLRAVFAQCEAEDNVGGNMVLLEIIRDTFPAMEIKEKRQSLGLLIGDITRCLSAEMPDEIYEQAFSLLGSLWNDEQLREQIRPEFSTTILNSNDKRLISALKTIMASSDPASLSSSSSSSHLNASLSGPGASSSSSSSSSSLRGVHSNKAQASSSSSYWSDSDSSTTGGMAPIAQRKIAPPGDTSPKVLKLSFLPHSMTEQWLLAHNAEELSFALDEINSVYNALSVSVREKARADMPRALKQIIFNLSGEALSVLISGLRLMESIAESHVEAFISELDALFPKLHRYLEDQREILRRSALRLSVALAARLPFQLTENFITSAVEHKSIFSDCALKLAGIALLNVSSAGGIQVNLSDGGGNSPKQLTSQQVRAARIAKAAVGYLAVDQELAAKLSATGQEVEQTPRTEATYEVAHDVIAAALLVLCPHEADTETGIFPETLPQSFLSMLLLGSGQGLTRTVQNEVSLRASGLSFPSLVKDSDVSAQVHMLLAMRMGHETNKAMSGGLRDRADSMSSRERGGVGGVGGSGGRGSGGRGSDSRSRSASPAMEAIKSQPSFLAGGPASPTMNRVKSKLFDAAAELNKGCSTVTEQLDDGDEGVAAQAHGYAYVPSWSDDPEHAVLLQSHEWSNNPGSPITTPSTPHTPGGSVDQSKLATLKRFGRKPGSRRAHSAEVTSSTALLSDLEPAPSTSDGVRSGAGGTLERLGGRGKLIGGDASEEDMGFSPKNASDAAIGNFLDDEERNQMMAAVKAKPVKPKRRPNAGNAGSASSSSSSAAQAFESLSLRDASQPAAQHPLSSSAPKVVHSPRGTAAGVSSLPGAGGTVGSRYRSAMEPTIPSPAGARVGAGASRHQVAGASSSSATRDSASSAAAVAPGRDNSYQYQIGTPVKAMDLFSTLGHPGAELGDSPDEQSFPSTSPTAADAFGSPTKRRTARNRVDQPSPQHSQQGQQLASPTDKDGRPSALKPESLEYLETEDLKPLPYAAKELPRVIGALEVQDWPDVFYTINSARQLAVHHSVLLNGGGSLHALVHGLLRCADNLRSAVAKNAILALADLFQGMERGMDSELPAVLAMLLKKCGETSIFLNEAAELAIQRMIEHSTAQRSLLGLLSGTDNRNPTLRGKVARYLHSLVLARASELKGARELEGLKIKLGKMIGDHTPEARASARDVARIMIEAGLVSRADLELHVAPDQLAKALNPANNMVSSSSPQRGLSASPKRTPANRRRVVSDSGVGSSIESDGGEFAGGGRPSALFIPSYDDDGTGLSAVGDEQAGPFAGMSRSKLRSSSESTAGGGGGKALASSGSGTAAPSRAKVAAAKRVMESNEELLALPTLMTASGNPNWIERREALSAITDLVTKYATVLRDASKLDACVERLLERLDDGSIKVQQHTLGCLQRLHKESPTILPSMQLFVVPAFLSAASSSNKQIGASALGVMMDILAAVPAQQVVQQLCQTALHDKERLRSMSLRLLADNMHKYCEQTDNPATSNIVRKHIYPTITQTIFSVGTKGDVRVAAAEALKALQHCCPMGESVWAWETDPGRQEELRKMVGGKN